jgi:hypothetical protein
MNMRGRLLVVLFVACFFAGCTSIDCPVKNTVYTVCDIYDGYGNLFKLEDTMYVFTTRKNGSDTLIYNAGVGKSSFTLPIGYSNPEDTLYFVFVNTDYAAKDTVLIKKENYPHFESVDCSASFFHRLTGVRSSRHAIDSIRITKDFVDYDASTAHFHIYFTPRH